jgi:flavin-dependent dehydrogenase
MPRVAEMTDVFVAGGGPAGLAVAIAARQRGFRVTVADYQQPPIDKACGEGLMPEGVEALRQLGVCIPPSVSYPFQGIRFIGAEHRVDARFPSGHGLAVRRTILHSLLLDRATELGVAFRWRTSVTALHDIGILAGGDSIQAKWIIGADGSASMIRRLAGLGRWMFNSRRFGFRRHFRVAPWSGYTEVYWGKGCQAYVTPVGPQEVSVAVLSRDPRLRVNQIVEQIPELGSRLQGAEATTTERGAISGNSALWRVYRGRVILAGDASGTVDAITGDGLSVSFRQALALASALETGYLSSYATAHRRLAMRPLVMSSLLLSLDRYPWLRKRVLRVLAGDPRFFEGLLALHAGSRTAPRYVCRRILPLCLQLFRLTAVTDANTLRPTSEAGACREL